MLSPRRCLDGEAQSSFFSNRIAVKNSESQSVFSHNWLHVISNKRSLEQCHHSARLNFKSGANFISFSPFTFSLEAPIEKSMH